MNWLITKLKDLKMNIYRIIYQNTRIMKDSWQLLLSDSNQFSLFNFF